MPHQIRTQAAQDQRALQIMRASHQVLVRATDEPTLLAEICRVLVERGGYRMVWVGFPENDVAKSVRIGAVAGHNAGYVEQMQPTWADTERGQGPIGVAIRTGQVAGCGDFSTDPKVALWRAEAARRGYGSSLALPLQHGGKSFGVLSLYVAQAHAFPDAERELLAELAGNLAYGLQALRAQLENTRLAHLQAEALEQLQHSEERFRHLADNITDVFWITSPDSQLIYYVSPGYERVWDRPIADLLEDPQQWMAAILAEDRAGIFEALAKVSTECREISMEYRIAWPDGSLRWIHDRAFAVLDAAGQLIRIAGVASDITEQKLAAEKLRLSERRSRKIINLSPVPMALNDEQLNITFLNPAFVETFGYTLADIPTLADWWPKAYPDPAYRQTIVVLWQHRMETAKRTATPFVPLQVNLRCRDGSVKTVLASATSLAGKFEGEHLVVLYDITERKRVEEAHARLAIAVDQAEETIVITDTEGNIVYANPAFEKTTGYGCAAAIGQNIRLLKSGKQDPAIFLAMWSALKRGETWRGHFINRRQDGAIFEENATISPIRNEFGKIVNYVAVKRDVTREMQLEVQFRQSQKMEAIGHLAGGVAHDFNNLLASILMQVELANMGETLPPDVQEGLQQIGADANRAAELTRQLLLFSRRQVLQSQLLDLNHSVTSLAKMLQRIIGEDVRLQMNLHPTPLLTHADAGMLDQVLMNLAVNARDAMTHGGSLRLTTLEKIVVAPLPGELPPEAPPGHYVGFSVRDTGGGIPAEILPHIFEPFFTTKGEGKGTGLGLATVFGIVKQHQGWIHLDNRPGDGVTFEVYFPASRRLAEEIASRPAKPKPRGQGETIFLVEDEENVRRAIRSMLERFGYTVVEAHHGPAACELWPTVRASVALLLTDLVMPGDMDGRELAQKLVAETPALKVIFMSGYSDELAGRELHLRPREKFIQKPFDPSQILELIQQSLAP